MSENNRIMYHVPEELQLNGVQLTPKSKQILDSLLTIIRHFAKDNNSHVRKG